MQGTQLFEGLSQEQREQLLVICAIESFEAGDVIHRAGTNDGLMHLILGGAVNLVTPEGRFLAQLNKGQCVGETALLVAPNAQISHKLSALADDSVETASFSVRDFSELIRRRPDIGVIVYRNLASDISGKLSKVD